MRVAAPHLLLTAPRKTGTCSPHSTDRRRDLLVSRVWERGWRGRRRWVCPDSDCGPLPSWGQSRGPCGLGAAASLPAGGAAGGDSEGLSLHVNTGGGGAGSLPWLTSTPPRRPRHQRRPGALQHRHQHPGGIHQQGGCLRPVSGPAPSPSPGRPDNAPPPKAAPPPPPASEPSAGSTLPRGWGPGRDWGPRWR